MAGKIATTGARAPVPVEFRTIVVAKGIQFNNSPIPDLQAKLPGLIPSTDGMSALYYSKGQSVSYRINVVLTKSELKTALETPSMFVIYGGHARYGRGGCFGTSAAQGDDWEDGTAPDTTGMYRMGFTFVPIPLSDILHHGYHYTPVSASVPLNTKGWSRSAERHTDLNNSLGNLHTTTIDDLLTKLIASGQLSKIAGNLVNEDYQDAGTDPSTVSAAQRQQDIANKVNWSKLMLPSLMASGLDRTAAYWYFDGPNHAEGASLPQLALQAGWQNTSDAPMDLGSTNLQCRVFCHFGCSSKYHFRSVVRDQKSWQQNGNEGYAFFTTAPSHDSTTAIWLYHVLTFPKFNSKQSWDAMLKYAVQHTNIDLINAGETFQVN